MFVTLDEDLVDWITALRYYLPPPPSNPNGDTLSEQAFEQLTVLAFAEIENPKEDRCPITLEPFTANTIVIQLPCNHYFMPAPIYQWLVNQKNTCPVCTQVPKINPASTLAPALHQLLSPSEITEPEPTRWTQFWEALKRLIFCGCGASMG
jgi:hypothetical protein